MTGVFVWTACAAGLLLAGCTTSPVSGRPQFNLLPGELGTVVPELRFEVTTLLGAGDESCREAQVGCASRERAQRLAERLAPIAERLGVTAARLSPEMTFRIPQVQVFVLPGASVSVSSSAGGRIAVGAGLAALDLSDTDLAFALAREFGRLAAAHHRESASAGLAISLIAGSPLTSAYLATTVLADILFPMGAMAKLGISLLASMGTEQLVEAAQQAEADDYAGKLLLAAGYAPDELGRPLPAAERASGWLAGFHASRLYVAATARADPWPDEAPPRLAPAEPWPDIDAPAAGPPPPAEPWPDVDRTAAGPLPRPAPSAGPPAQTTTAAGAKRTEAKKKPSGRAWKKARRTSKRHRH